jgi:hypothetical protein
MSRPDWRLEHLNVLGDVCIPDHLKISADHLRELRYSEQFFIVASCMKLKLGGGTVSTIDINNADSYLSMDDSKFLRLGSKYDNGSGEVGTEVRLDY